MTTLSRFTNLAAALAAASLLAACSEPATDVNTAEPAKTQTEEAQQTLKLTEVNPRLGEYIKTLSSDEFQGRAPATKGEELTVAYLEDNFRRIGLKAIDGDSYKQPVSLVQIDPKEVSAMALSGDNVPAQFAYRDEMTAWTKQVTEQVEVKDSDMVFVGYGIVAPEYGWNDYEGIDMEGKTAVILVNDPDFGAEALDRIIDYISRDHPSPDWDTAMRELITTFPQLGFEEERDWRSLAEGSFRAGPDNQLHIDWDPAIADTLGQDEHGFDLWALFRALKPRPVLAFRGANADALAPETFARMVEIMPEMTAVTVDNRAHTPTLREPIARSAIVTFLDQVDGY